VKGDWARGTPFKKQKIVWKRVAEVIDHPVLFSNSSSMLRQGNIGNCYLVASLFGLSRIPGRIEDMFITKKVNKQGIYAMKFFINGKKALVYVDDFIPIRKGENKKDEPAFVKSFDKNEIWPILMEKAWAKLVGSYGNSEVGTISWTLRYLTNDPVYHSKISDVASLTQTLITWLDKGYPVFLFSHSKAWVKNHVFTLTKIEEIEGEVKFTLHNPWGYS